MYKRGAVSKRAQYQCLSQCQLGTCKRARIACKAKVERNAGANSGRAQENEEAPLWRRSIYTTFLAATTNLKQRVRTSKQQSWAHKIMSGRRALMRPPEAFDWRRGAALESINFSASQLLNFSLLARARALVVLLGVRSAQCGLRTDALRLPPDRRAQTN